MGLSLEPPSPTDDFATTAPPAGTLERWAWDYLHSDALAYKLAPPEAPDVTERDAPVRRVLKPARPAALTVVDRAEKVPLARRTASKAREIPQSSERDAARGGVGAEQHGTEAKAGRNG